MSRPRLRRGDISIRTRNEQKEIKRTSQITLKTNETTDDVHGQEILDKKLLAQLKKTFSSFCKNPPLEPVLGLHDHTLFP